MQSPRPWTAMVGSVLGTDRGWREAPRALALELASGAAESRNEVSIGSALTWSAPLPDLALPHYE